MGDTVLKRPSYFLVFSLIGLFAAFAGFAKTFFLPMAAGSFTAPVSIHIHGAFAFAWIILFVIQTSLIHAGKYNLHALLGITGVLIAIGVTLSLIPTGFFIVERALAKGEGQSAYSGMVGVITSGLLFLALVIAGLVNRKRSDYHKRYMLLATIVVLWPAWFRFRHFFPAVPRPDIWFALVLADSLILVAWVWEKIKYGRIHPVLKYAGIFIILEQTFEILAYDSANWRIVGKWIYQSLSGN